METGGNLLITPAFPQNPPHHDELTDISVGPRREPIDIPRFPAPQARDDLLHGRVIAPLQAVTVRRIVKA
jgi:hypothetical protein